MAKFGGVIRDMGGFARAVTNLSQRLYSPPPNTISGIDPEAYPNPLQPVKPIGPEGSEPLFWPFWFGQNLLYTPRADALYSAADLRALATYPLSRMCIDNAKDMLCQMEWNIQLKQMPGESIGDVKSRRKKTKSGDDVVFQLTKLFEHPNPEQDWSEWLRRLLEEMLVIDAASILLRRNGKGQILEMWAIPGDNITRYIDQNGFTPQPPNPAYAQLWQGMPRVDLTTDQLVYRPRNIVPRGSSPASYLYGMSPTESIADEIKIGMARLAFVMAFYDKGSFANMIHVIPSKANPDKMKEAMQWFNSTMSGNLNQRRQYNMIQGFTDDGKDQIIFPDEPVLADTFDDVHIRKIAFAYGASPQRLQKMMNRASAQVSQTASQEEGIKPWMDWAKRLVDYIIQVKMGFESYEIGFSPEFDTDITKQSKVDQLDVHEGIRTRDEVRYDRGLDPLESQNPLAGKLTVTTANGVVELGQVIVSGRPDKGGSDGGSATQSPTPKSSTKVNGVYEVRRN